MTRSWTRPLNTNPPTTAPRGPSRGVSGRNRKRWVRSRNAVFQRRPQNSLDADRGERPVHQRPGVDADASARRTTADGTSRSAARGPVPTMPTQPTRYGCSAGRAWRRRRARQSPASELAAANSHSRAVGRRRRWRGSGTRPRPGPARPAGSASVPPARARRRGRASPGQPLARRIDATASAHMTAQRGHDGGEN